MNDQQMEIATEILTRHAVLLVKRGPQVRSKPICGGSFGSGGYFLASHWSVVDRLDEVIYFVVHGASLTPIGTGASKAEALAGAREILSLIDVVSLEVLYGRSRAAVAAHRAELVRQHDAARSARQAECTPLPKPIPKRRRQVFEKSGGKCHYCGATLALDGRWHIEHKMPRALLGGSELGNLVASCVPCNLQKSDSTDLEFEAKRAGLV